MGPCEVLDDERLRKLTRTLLEGYVKENNLIVRHQIDSFDDFILHKLEQIISSFNPIDINECFLPDKGLYKHRVIVSIENPTLTRPTITEKDGQQKIMLPNDARLRNMTYSSQLMVEVAVTTKVLNTDTNEYQEESKRVTCVSLGKIPIMVHSRYCNLRQQAIPSPHDECRFDYGGYFVINGNEKVVIAQDRIAENKPFVFVNNKATPYSHVAEVRSVSERRFGIPKTTAVKLSTRGNQFGKCIRVNVHHMKHEIPLFILFRALGVESDADVVRHVVGNVDDSIVKELVGSMDEASNVRTHKDAIVYLMRFIYSSNSTSSTTATSVPPKPPPQPKEGCALPQHNDDNTKAEPTTTSTMTKPAVNRFDVVMNMLEHELFPHIGTDLYLKAVYLGYMVKKLLKCYTGQWALDDRDSYVNKRIDTPGILIANLFRQYYAKTVKDMRNLILKDVTNWPWRATNKLINVITINNVYKLIKPTIIESGLKYGLATGNWGVKSSRQRQGVAQVLNRMTYLSTLSHLRRINTPIEKTGKLVQPRKLHPTQWGVICPSECFDPETPILLWDGSIRAAKTVRVGDSLIDDTGNAVKVKSTCAGFKTMYEVVPDKTNFMRHTVTDNHILTLKVKSKSNLEDLDKDSDVIDITIEKYLSLPEHVQQNLYIFKSDGIHWERREVALDPYILGMWLGHGLSSGSGFTTADKELLGKWTEWGGNNGGTINPSSNGCNQYSISSTPLEKLLSQYGLLNNKHIPREYLVNDRKTRLAVLAGLIDTDGHVVKGHEIRICQDVSDESHYQILYDAEFLAGSLGFSCHLKDGVHSYASKPFKELTITGDKLHEIPTVLPRKKLHKPDLSESLECSLQSSFKLVKKDVGPFVGWQLDGNGRFLLGDRSTSHNTPEGASVGLVKNLAMTTTVTIASSATHLRRLLLELGMSIFDVGCDISHYLSKTLVFVNGVIVGVHADPPVLYHSLKRAKRSGRIHVHTGIVWNVFRNEIIICTEGGRCCRPLYILSDGKSTRINQELACKILSMSERPSWAQLVLGRWRSGVEDAASQLERFTHDNGDHLSTGNKEEPDESIIEYLDVEEANCAMVAMTPSSIKDGMRYTHMEMDPSLMLGAIAGAIPFSDHNQAPRNTYQCLWLEEPVLMADGTRKKIKDVAVGDEVVTFNPETLVTSVTTVVNQYVRTTDKRIFQVTTSSGRTIRATHDHKFMTWKGWLAVEDFGSDTLLGIRPIGADLAKDLEHEYKKIKTHAVNKGLNPIQCVEQCGPLDTLGDLIFVPIDSLVEVPNCLIADITVASDNHSFIGGDGFAVHNSAMGKQAISVYSSNFRHRFDTVGHVLNYPQRPLVSTQMSTLLHGNDLPSGINAIVAIATYTGFNR